MDRIAGQGITPLEPTGQEAFDRALTSLRPKLHRYCARMVGSGIDGEDVLQEALLKAVEAFPGAAAIGNLEAWLFRIAHNTALDFLRSRVRQQRVVGDEDVAMIADPVDEIHQRQAAAAALHAFMRLPVAQRSTVILKDVLGYSLEEIGGITKSTIPAVKAALHRGRDGLRAAAQEPDDRSPPILSEAERARLSAYVQRFNARDFDSVRNMLAEDIRLELVNKTHLKGRSEVGRYFGNYVDARDWRFQLGFVDRRPAIVASDPSAPARRPTYFVLLHWSMGHIDLIRDFRHAPYVMEAAEVILSE